MKPFARRPLAESEMDAPTAKVGAKPEQTPKRGPSRPADAIQASPKIEKKQVTEPTSKRGPGRSAKATQASPKIEKQQESRQPKAKQTIFEIGGRGGAGCFRLRANIEVFCYSWSGSHYDSTSPVIISLSQPPAVPAMQGSLQGLHRSRPSMRPVHRCWTRLLRARGGEAGAKLHGPFRWYGDSQRPLPWKRSGRTTALGEPEGLLEVSECEGAEAQEGGPWDAEVDTSTLSSLLWHLGRNPSSRYICGWVIVVRSNGFIKVS